MFHTTFSPLYLENSETQAKSVAKKTEHALRHKEKYSLKLAEKSMRHIKEAFFYFYQIETNLQQVQDYDTLGYLFFLWQQSTGVSGRNKKLKTLWNHPMNISTTFRLLAQWFLKIEILKFTNR